MQTPRTVPRPGSHLASPAAGPATPGGRQRRPWRRVPAVQRAWPIRAAAGFGVIAVAAAACAFGSSGSTPVPTPFGVGTPASPRNVIIVMADYRYQPAVVDLVPGETVNLQVINAGLEVHEAIIGDMPAQLAWESAEAATVGAPPGPTPFVSPPPGFNGPRIVATSGQRLDVVWTVPPDAASNPSGWFFGCHIPGHWAKGMVAPVRFVDASDKPIASLPELPTLLPMPSGS